MIKHPAAMMKADAWKRMRAMLGEFGMTPSSRSKVNRETTPDDDLISKFLNSRD
jgi:P27 family predicted phage terminase small subunit